MPTQWGDTMGFFEVLTQVIELLQRQERVSYRALKREFDLDDAYLEDLKAEIIQAKKLAVDEDGVVLIWAEASAISELTSPPAQPTQLPPVQGQHSLEGVLLPTVPSPDAG